MSDKLLCPFCQQELSYMDTIDGGFEIFSCDCKKSIWFFGNDKLWQELITTRKALDLAIQFLESLRSSEDSPIWVVKHTNRKMEQINEIKGGK